MIVVSNREGNCYNCKKKKKWNKREPDVFANPGVGGVPDTSMELETLLCTMSLLLDVDDISHLFIF